MSDNESNEVINLSVVLNDDLLYLILSQLNVKDLFALKTVCRQFWQCLDQVLRLKKEISIGFKYVDQHKKNDITKWLVRDGYDFLNYSRHSRLESILWHFFSVETLLLANIHLDFDTMEVLTDHCPQLQTLKLHYSNIHDRHQRSPAQWALLLSNLKHIVFNSQRINDISFMADIIRGLQSLESIQIYTNISPTLLANCLPANIRRLSIRADNLSTDALDIVTTKCSQIQYLEIRDGDNLDYHWLDWFVMICNRLKRLEKFIFTFDNISAQDFAKNITNLKDLRHLVINNLLFNANAIRLYSKHPMMCKTLSLIDIKCSPKMWSNLAQLLPNVRKLKINEFDCHIDCQNADQCTDNCYHRCIQCVASLPKLRHLSLGRHIKFPDLLTLDLLVGLDVLRLNRVPNDWEQLISFITVSLAKYRRHFRLELDYDFRNQLIREIRDDKHLKIPDNVDISCIY